MLFVGCRRRKLDVAPAVFGEHRSGDPLVPRVRALPVRRTPPTARLCARRRRMIRNHLLIN